MRPQRLIDYEGRQWTASDLAFRFNISVTLLRSRIFDLGWSVERAIDEKNRDPERNREDAYQRKNEQARDQKREQALKLEREQAQKRDREIAHLQAAGLIDQAPPPETRKTIPGPTPSTAKVNFQGRMLTVRDVARLHGMPPQRLYDRLFVLDWSLERALSDR